MHGQGAIAAETVGFAVNVLNAYRSGLVDQDLGAAFMRHLYRFGGLGVMLLAIADSSFLSVPEGNDLLIVILSAGKSWGTMAYYVGMTTIGSVIGCILLYSVGRKGRQSYFEAQVFRGEDRTRGKAFQSAMEF